MENKETKMLPYNILMFIGGISLLVFFNSIVISPFVDMSSVTQATVYLLYCIISGGFVGWFIMEKLWKRD
jgi:hypothetical protein